MTNFQKQRPGLECEKCHGATSVVQTYNLGNVIIRKRLCDRCDHVMRTRETIIPRQKADELLASTPPAATPNLFEDG
jgi:hypothetical protein